MICEECGMSFDREMAETDFSIEFSNLSYDNVCKCLCGDCAITAIKNKVDGVYFETCDRCGKNFDLFVEEMEFDNHFSDFSGTDLRDYWDDQILCADCAIEEAEIL